jgi:peptidyl-tRNA hydrolase
MRKLFLVTRADLSAGQQAVQAAHAMREFAEQHPEADGAWYRESNTLALLVVSDEAALRVLLEKARRRDILTSAFREPDHNNEMTAIALDHGARGLVSKLPLALAERSHSSIGRAGDSKSPSVAGSSPAGGTATNPRSGCSPSRQRLDRSE